ncbi:CPCC family cysteine-rich protein [Micromonospora sp. NPDC023644]|uniref:CPCC family cysteine-rich protein n=1 Tax=Micromonospora sp. NPDC023644 TaxID=3154321 RepID=UPI0033FD88AB
MGDQASVYVRRGPEGGPYGCPCCRCITLDERGMYQICVVCFWEDDGSDDASAHEPSGPNGSLTLAQARENFARFGACDELGADWPDQFEEVRCRLADGMPVDAAIALMRQRGLSRLASMKVLWHLVVADVGAVRHLIDESAVWVRRRSKG